MIINHDHPAGPTDVTLQAPMSVEDSMDEAITSAYVRHGNRG